MRMVLKVGTRVVTGRRGFDRKKAGLLMKEIARAMRSGHEVVLVSSGAIGTGMLHLRFSDPHKKKVAAAVGQPLLMHGYINEGKKHGVSVGQVLILSDDFTDRERFKNFVENIEAMLAHKILPIINENDFVKTEDLTVGDNDMLSAMVAAGVRADKLVILTNQNGLYTENPDHSKDAVLIKKVEKVDAKIEKLCVSGKSDMGIGGMLSKVQAAKYATERGIETYVGNGLEKGILSAILRKKNFSGTVFKAEKKKK